MISIKIEFESKAKLEISEAFEWYENTKEGLGEEFLKAIDFAIKNILKSPSAFVKVRNHNQYVMKKFPFVILYEKTKETLFIDAVFHTSRNPKNKFKLEN